LRAQLKKAEKVRGLREKIKDLAYAKFVEVQDKHLSAVETINYIARRKQKLEELFRKKCSDESLYLEELWRVRMELSSMEEELEEMLKYKCELEEQLNALRQELLKKNLDLKLAERMVERKKEGLRKEILRDQQKELDERAMLMFVRST